MDCKEQSLIKHIIRQKECGIEALKLSNMTIGMVLKGAMIVYHNQLQTRLNPKSVFILKELIQLTLGAVNLSRGKMLPGALITGKICTTVLFVSLTGLVLFPNISNTVVRFIAAADASFLLISFISYLSAYLGSHPKTKNLE